MAYLQPALMVKGDWETVTPIVQQILNQGNGATRQRGWLQETQHWQTVVDR